MNPVILLVLAYACVASSSSATSTNRTDCIRDGRSCAKRWIYQGKHRTGCIEYIHGLRWCSLVEEKKSGETWEYGVNYGVCAPCPVGTHNSTGVHRPRSSDPPTDGHDNEHELNHHIPLWTSCFGIIFLIATTILFIYFLLDRKLLCFRAHHKKSHWKHHKKDALAAAAAGAFLLSKSLKTSSGIRKHIVVLDAKEPEAAASREEEVKEDLNQHPLQ